MRLIPRQFTVRSMMGTVVVVACLLAAGLWTAEMIRRYNRFPMLKPHYEQRSYFASHDQEIVRLVITSLEERSRLIPRSQEREYQDLQRRIERLKRLSDWYAQRKLVFDRAATRPFDRELSSRFMDAAPPEDKELLILGTPYKTRPLQRRARGSAATADPFLKYLESAGLRDQFQGWNRTKKLMLWGKETSDEVLSHLRRFTALEDLQFLGKDVDVTDAGLVHLLPLSSLRLLDLNNTKVTDRGLASVAALTELRGLHLVHTRVTDQGLAQLKKLHHLESLALNDTAITDSGVEHLLALKNLKKLYLAGTQVSDAGLARLSALTGLSTLVLGETRVTDSGMSSLEGLSALRELNLYRTTVGDDGLARLASLTRLELLRLDDTRVTGAGLKYLRGMTRLKSLSLGSAPVADGDLVHLAPLTRLEFLGLEHTKIQGTGLVHLKGMTVLESLSLIKTPLDDDALRHLEPLKGLHYLFLDGTPVGDAGLRHLRRCTGLDEVSATHSRVTPAGMADLQKALPRLSVPIGDDEGEPVDVDAIPSGQSDPPGISARGDDGPRERAAASPDRGPGDPPP